MSKPRITAEMLLERGACEVEVEIFRKHWPGGARPLLRTIRKAARLGLNLAWFGNAFLPEAGLQEFERAMIPAWSKYQEVVSQALAERWGAQDDGRTWNHVSGGFKEVEGSAFQAYQKAAVQSLYDAIQKHGLDLEATTGSKP